MGLRLAPPALAIACFLAVLAGSLTFAAGTRAQPAAPAPEAPAPALPSAVVPSPPAQAGGAERGPIALHWVRLPDTERCIAGDALARAVESKLRRSVFPAARDATILIEGHVRKSEQGYAAELHMRDQSGKALGSRELASRDESCTELSDTLAVVLAVMIDPDAAKRPPSAQPAAGKEQAETAIEREAGAENRVLAFGRALLAITERPLLGFGTAYERSLGVAGGLRIEVAMFAENSTPLREIASEPEAQALVRVAYAGVAYCPLWLEFKRTRLIGCAGLELGGVRGHDSNFPIVNRDQQSPPDGTGLWASASASVRLAITIVGSLEAHIAAGLVGVFGQRFVVRAQSGRPVRILPDDGVPLGALLDLGLGARF
jgi:hypothetical protein